MSGELSPSGEVAATQRLSAALLESFDALALAVRLADAAAAHAVVADHRHGHARDASEVVGRAGRDRAEHQVLGGAPAQRHAHDVDDLRARPERDLLG